MNNIINGRNINLNKPSSSIVSLKLNKKEISNKGYKIFILILSLNILVFILFFIEKYTKIIKRFFNYYTKNKKYAYNNNYKSYFNNILPKLNLDNQTIPSLEEIFNSRIIYISDANLTREYIRYIRPINKTEEKKYRIRYSENETKISPDNFKKRAGQYNYIEFAKICLQEKLLDTNKIEYNNKPLISVILPSYNKETILLKSIRSIQNQSFKNIEIIIVNDGSTDNSEKIFKYLLETDPRIRIFHHLKNMGCWRSRLDGILYSKGKNIILFDTADLYEDNYVLEDAYNILTKYNLDSAKYLFRLVRNYKYLNLTRIPFHVNNNSKIIYGPSNINTFNIFIFGTWGNIWNRLTRANIYIKGIYLLNDYVLNLYKNFWDDFWFNTIIHRVSFSFLIYERIGYIYLSNEKGVGSARTNTDVNRDKYIKEILGFLYFDYNMLPKNNNKKTIINKLKKYDNNKDRYQLSFLRSKFDVLYNIINILIKDPYVYNDDKIFLNKTLKKYKIIYYKKKRIEELIILIMIIFLLKFIAKSKWINILKKI